LLRLLLPLDAQVCFNSGISAMANHCRLPSLSLTKTSNR